MQAYDLLILGAGPAGITAAVYAARKKLNFLVVSEDIGGQTVWSGDIENYTGYQFITGVDLSLKFQEHIDSYGITVNLNEKVEDIRKEGDLFKTVTNKAKYLSKTLIVATGKSPRLIGVEGEKEFKSKGVTYCATCDGPLYKGKPIAIIGGGNSGLEAALQMVKFSPQVHIIDLADKLSGDRIMVDKLKNNPLVTIWNKARVKKIYGDQFVQGLEVEQGKEVKKINVQGVFVEVGLDPNSKFTQILEKNKREEIVVDCHNQTSMPGIFSAGDVTNVPEKQIIIACGEGAKACLSAFKYLSRLS